ncbi:MAG: Na+/H+ antiporter subunit E [Bacteroidales bacterium]|nr:Na+/H+ antiporter subunit E [Bacteroidales bacterium]
MKIKNILALFLILFFIWVMINNQFQIEVMIIGVILSLVISVIMGNRLTIFNELKFSFGSVFYTIWYLFVFLTELVKSNLDVARRVLTPSLPINPGIIKTKTVLKSKMGKMILANSITLTPGTLTVDIEDDILYIHCIDVCCEDIDKATAAIVGKFEKILVKIYG